MIRNKLWILISLLCISLLTGCAKEKEIEREQGTESTKLTIITTLFPQYDFTRQIVGEKAEVTLLLPPGMESHSYEPSPSDMIRIHKSDLFIYTGPEMEAWAESMISGLEGNTAVLNISEGMKLSKEEEDGHTDHGLNPHIWTSPILAEKMVQNIVKAVVELDPENADYYQENGKTYIRELKKLDIKFRDIVNGGQRKEMIFGGRFAFHYFVEEYGLTYRSAYDSCSSETEPSVKVIAEICDEIKNKKIPVVFYEELANKSVAESISEATGAKMLLFHSCHNVTSEEMKSGATYLSLMESNASALLKALMD